MRLRKIKLNLTCWQFSQILPFSIKKIMILNLPNKLQNNNFNLHLSNKLQKNNFNLQKMKIIGVFMK